MANETVQFGQKGHVYRLLPKEIFDRFDLSTTSGRLAYSPDNWHSVVGTHKAHAGQILVCTNVFTTGMNTYYDQYTNHELLQRIAMVKTEASGWALYLNTHWAVELTSADFEAGHLITTPQEFIEHGFSFAGNPCMQNKWRTKTQQSVVTNSAMFPVRNPRSVGLGNRTSGCL